MSVPLIDKPHTKIASMEVNDMSSDHTASQFSDTCVHDSSDKFHFTMSTLRGEEFPFVILISKADCCVLQNSFLAEKFCKCTWCVCAVIQNAYWRDATVRPYDAFTILIAASSQPVSRNIHQL